MREKYIVFVGMVLVSSIFLSSGVVADTTPPLYSKVSDDSGGMVGEGTIVNTSVFWKDETSNLDYGWFYHNASGSISLEGKNEFSVNWVYNYSSIIESIYHNKDTGNTYIGGASYTLEKIDSSGNKVWSYDYGSTITSVDHNEDTGNTYIGGYSTLEKIDSSGNKVWSYDYGDEIESVDHNEDTGNTYIGGEAGTLEKIDSSGNKVWSYNYGDVIQSVDHNPSTGDTYIGGTGNTLEKINSSGNKVWNYDYFNVRSIFHNEDTENTYIGGDAGTLEKIDSSGNKVWSYDYGNWDDYIYSVDHNPSTGDTYIGGNAGTLEKIDSSGNIANKSINSSWFNKTINTTGHGDETIAWYQTANDTSGNLNGTMSSNLNTFEVDGPPEYSKVSDDSGGIVGDGTIVNVSTFWEDETSYLDKGLFYHNASGSMSLEGKNAFGGNNFWYNNTINTTGHGGETICWYQTANDTSGNLNDTMSSNLNTFEVDGPPEYSKVSDDSGGIVDEGTIVNTSVFWKDETSYLDTGLFYNNASGSMSLEETYKHHKYQEYANSTAEGGGWVDWENVIDGDWGTSGRSDYRYGYFNYTKPNNAEGGKWKVKDSFGIDNLSVPSDCFDENPLQLRVKSYEDTLGGLLDEVYWYCWTGSSWNTLRNAGQAQNSCYVYEEAMYWEMNQSWYNTTINTTGHAGETIAWYQTANDTFGNENTSMNSNLNTFYVTKEVSRSTEQSIESNTLVDRTTSIFRDKETSLSISTYSDRIVTATRELSSILNIFTSTEALASSTEQIQDELQPKEHPNFLYTEQWRPETDIDKTYTFPSSLDFIYNVTIVNSTDTYNLYFYNETSDTVEINKAEVTVDDNTVDLKATVEKVLVKYQELALGVTAFSLEDMVQDPYHVYDDYHPDNPDAHYNKTIPWYRQKVTTYNPSTQNTYKNVKANISMPNDTVSYDMEETDLNKTYSTLTDGELEWEMQRIASWREGEDEVTWPIYLDTGKMKVNENQSLETIEDRKYWIRGINTTLNETPLQNIYYETSIPKEYEGEDIRNDIIFFELYENGTEVTDEMNFVERDEDDDGFVDEVAWVDSSFGSWNNGDEERLWEVRAYRGRPIKVFEDAVITNKPVMEGKNIEWRVGYKFWNRNDFYVPYSKRLRVPLGAFDSYLNGDFKEIRYDDQGAYVQYEEKLPSESNTTAYLEYHTSPITVTEERFPPEKHIVGELSTYEREINVLSHLPDKTKDVEKRIQIDYGENLKVYHNGELYDEKELVESEYLLKIDEMNPLEELTFRLEFDRPTAEVIESEEHQTEEGNPLLYKKVQSNAGRPLDPLYLELEDKDCSEVKEAYGFYSGVEYEIECSEGDEFNPMIDLGKLGVNEEEEVAIVLKVPEKIVRADFGIIFGWFFFAVGMVSLIYIPIHILRYRFLDGDK